MPTRRGFMRMLAGATIAPVLPKIALAGPTPLILWGDGIHDDTAALSALFRGEVVEFADASMATPDVGWNGSILTLPRGTFRLNAPLIVNGTEDAPISVNAVGSAFLAGDDFEGDALFVVQNWSGLGDMKDVHIEWPSRHQVSIGHQPHNRAARRKAASNRRDATP